MKTLLKILGTIIGIAILLITVGFIQTYRVQHSKYQEQFLAGKSPSPFPDGFHKGSADFYTSNWQGKTFQANSGIGVNNFGTETTSTEKYSFKTYVEKGIQDQNIEPFKIDYDNGKNSWWLSPLLDEIVEVAPGQYLGKISYRLIPGSPFALGYFKLESTNPNLNTIRNITVSGKYFSIKLPQNWQIDFNDPKGTRLNELLAWTKDFKMHTETSSSSSSTPGTYFESGAKLDILAEKGLISYKQKIEGKILETSDITIAGIKTKVNTLVENTTKQGEILDARIEYKGNSYIFRFAYNKDSFPDAKKFFLERVESFKFLQ
jgi:hypothetical protein